LHGGAHRIAAFFSIDVVNIFRLGEPWCRPASGGGIAEVTAVDRPIGPPDPVRGFVAAVVLRLDESRQCGHTVQNVHTVQGNLVF